MFEVFSARESEMAKFNVTYEIVTPESAEQGDAEERGFIARDISLREAIELALETRTAEVGGIESIEPSEHPGDNFRWITITNGTEYRTGAQESRSLHIPDHVTPSSRARLWALLRA